jgi:uncharacterized flavoprotein (TIGR03862 family)
MIDHPSSSIAIIGGGPAGLMAAEVLAAAGLAVDLYDAMPSVGRKFLLAGVGGMNITHSEAYPAFVSRYRERQDAIDAWLKSFDANALCDWIHGLGIDTFVGTSGRVFPTDMKAAPLLRAWLRRLRELGVNIHTRHRWTGWDESGLLCITGPSAALTLSPHATVLALGGASWPRLGSDGAWVTALAERGLDVAPLCPSNCGFDVERWSALLVEKFAGAPLKNVALSLDSEPTKTGEFILTRDGIEGSLVYAFSAPIRQAIARNGTATVHLDLLPSRSREQIAAALAKPRGSRSMSKHLHTQIRLEGVKAALLRELAPREAFDDPTVLASWIKSLPIVLHRPKPIEEAISSAGGVRLEGLDDHLMARAQPGLFFAGEMLDWEAPTGGYLLTACFASGRKAANGVLEWLRVAEG